MFDWLGKNAGKSGKSQGILISCVSGNPDLHSVYDIYITCMEVYNSGHIILNNTKFN